jgi:hypothetical protein
VHPSAPQPLDRQVHDGLCDKEAADGVELSEVVLGSINSEPAQQVRFGNDAKRADGSQSENLRGLGLPRFGGQFMGWAVGSFLRGVWGADPPTTNLQK